MIILSWLPLSHPLRMICWMDGGINWAFWIKRIWNGKIFFEWGFDKKLDSLSVTGLWLISWSLDPSKQHKNLDILWFTSSSSSISIPKLSNISLRKIETAAFLPTPFFPTMSKFLRSVWSSKLSNKLNKVDDPLVVVVSPPNDFRLEGYNLLLI